MTWDGTIYKRGGGGGGELERGIGEEGDREGG